MRRSFTWFAWFSLIYTVGVILWGAWVRVTGSGAGCGSSWPLCNGEIVPPSPEIATIIEFVHRATSGVALLLVVLLVVWAFKIFPPGHMARRCSVAALAFMITEALIGAGLVVFELVGDNDSFARAWVMAVHLVNTFVLLGALSLTAWFSHPPGEERAQGQQQSLLLPSFSVAALLIVGASGAVAALGDTLFPSASLEAALRADFSPASHFLIRLRIYHPLLALLTTVLVIYTCYRLERESRGRWPFRLAILVVSLLILQILIGFVNVWLLAPAWLQLIHLLVSDLIWITFVLLLGATRGRVVVPKDQQTLHTVRLGKEGGIS